MAKRRELLGHVERRVGTHLFFQEWMHHCHILEHRAAGMMGHFEVVR